MKNKNKKMIKIINKKEKVRFFGDNTIHKVKNSPPKIISLIDNNKIFINQKQFELALFLLSFRGLNDVNLIMLLQ